MSFTSSPTVGSGLPLALGGLKDIKKFVATEAVTNDAAMKDYLKRELGIETEQKRNDRYIEALTKPETYEATKKALTEQILETLLGDYKEMVWTLYSQGLPTAEAEKAAGKYILGRYEALLEAYSITYPGLGKGNPIAKAAREAHEADHTRNLKAVGVAKE